MARKTVVCRFQKPNKKKLEAVEREYRNTQKYLQGEDDVDLYSATKQQMDRRAGNEDNEQPLFIRNDSFEVVERDTDLTKYWVRVPVASVYGGVWIPIQPHTDIQSGWDIGDSMIVRKDHGFELHLVVKKEVEEQEEYDGALGVDLGLRKLATATECFCGSDTSSKTLCLGSSVENYFDKYFHLRRNCRDGYVRKRWDGKVADKTEDLCHQISRKIVDHAQENNLFIAVGDLEGIQDKDRGKRMNRKLHHFPHWKLRNYIRYKADWEGIRVVEVDEAYTSQTCSRCGEKGERNKGNFQCPECDYETDADKNASHNIGERGIGKLNASSDSEGCVTQPLV
ncbi:MAG: IS200/IS605 family element transposase accessory protein TnpB [Nanohaloarchaea archaeon]|nr:IS200/IS605 family element transposase accessory protein TnpB [Candidatus Nanohaloarchaea archaeon]